MGIVNSSNPVNNPSAAHIKGPVKSAPASSSDKIDTSSTVSSVDKLPPKLKAMMEIGIAQNICVRIQHQSDDLKKIMREGREEQG